MRHHYTAIVCALFSACATANKGDIDALKPTPELFHGEMKWKNYRSLSQQVVPEKRDAFMKASDARDDEKNLFVTDYQLEDCKLNAADGTLAVCTSKVSWYRLPSASEKTVTVATTLKWQGGQWLIEKQSAGPFAQELTTSPVPDEKPVSEKPAPEKPTP